jgi:hypothetical protein
MSREVRKGATDAVEMTVFLEPGDSATDAIALARSRCDEAIVAARDTELRERLRAQMSSEEGRQALVRFLAETRP